MNEKGAGLIGLLLVAAIIALLVYGGSYFLPKKPVVKTGSTNDIVDQAAQTNGDIIKLHQIKNKAQEEIEKINKKIASSTSDY